MTQKIDLPLLRALAEFRLATAPLLAAQLETSEQMVRRRCRRLEGWNLVRVQPGQLGRGRGRPEWVYSLQPEGVHKLKQERALLPEVPPECVTGEKLARTVEHQLLINWMSVHSRSLMKTNPILQVEFISSKSPFHLSAGGGSVLHDQAEFPDGNKMGFTPDAALCIRHGGLNTSLLFFLEVDRGTERLASSGQLPTSSELRRKIIVYRTYLGRQGYTRFENKTLFSTRLKGFRLLLITVGARRYEALCRLVRLMAPTDFVWIVDYAMLQKHDMGAFIWSIGGRLDMKRSILQREQKGVRNCSNFVPEQLATV